MAITAFFITMMDETTLAGQKYKKDPKFLRVLLRVIPVMTWSIKYSTRKGEKTDIID
ncbi:hypothetical protein D3C83_145900 [compost metagenome]